MKARTIASVVVMVLLILASFGVVPSASSALSLVMNTGQRGAHAEFDGELIAFEISEQWYKQDLNGDGQFQGEVIQLYHISTGQAENTEVVGRSPSVSGNRIAFERSEGCVWDGDGDGVVECDFIPFILYFSIAPIQLGPADGGEVPEGEVLFTWGGVPGATGYHLQIDTADTFDSTDLIEATASETQYAVALSAGTWYWRVRALPDGAYTSAWQVQVTAYNPGGEAGLSSTPGWMVDGVREGDAFVMVARAGDVNGDGYADVLVGAPYYDKVDGVRQSEVGAAYLFYGSPAGLSTTAGWMVEGDQVGARLGFGVDGAGDVNGDGYDDILIGVYMHDNGQTDEGQALVYYGSPAGPGTTPDWAAESDQSRAWFGWQVGTAGDVNGDGYDDVIIGAPLYSNGQTNEGRAYVYHGSAEGLNTTPNWTAESDRTDANLQKVGTAGDINGDGYDDVVIGAENYSGDQYWEGKAWVYYGSADGLSSTPDWTAEGNQSEAHLGSTVNAAGDVNGDGFSDVAVAAYFYTDDHGREGATFVYHGSATGLGTTADWMAGTDEAGTGVSWTDTAGDVNEDGFADLCMGTNGMSRASIYYGSATGLRATPDWTAQGEEAYFGWPCTGVGDVNGDGHEDVAVGDHAYHNYTGRVYLFYGYGPSEDNRPPEVAIDQGTVEVQEGQIAANTGSASDPDGDPVMLSASVGTVTDEGNGTWSWNFATSDGPVESQTVTIYADDGQGGTSEASFDLIVDNVAPSIDGIVAPVEPMSISSQPIAVTVEFSDPGTADTHVVQWDWGDGGTDTQNGATSPASASHAYAEPGVYPAQVTVTDDDGGSDTETFQFIVIYNPEGGFVTGGGWIRSQAGFCRLDDLCAAAEGKANFGFVSRYQKGASVPTGNTEFDFKAGGLNFHSDSYDWLVVTGSDYARFKGLGTVNGEQAPNDQDYKFMLWARDGSSSDTFHIKIWWEDGAEEHVVYDNGFDQPIGGGSIQVHTK